jgi:hypothetical protein
MLSFRFNMLKDICARAYAMFFSALIFFGLAIIDFVLPTWLVLVILVI